MATSGKSKRRLVEEAVDAHLHNAGLVVGSASLREQLPEVLTAGEAASLLRVSEAQLLQAADRGQLPGRRIAGEWRFSRAALTSWLAAEPPNRPDSGR